RNTASTSPIARSDITLGYMNGSLYGKCRIPVLHTFGDNPGQNTRQGRLMMSGKNVRMGGNTVDRPSYQQGSRAAPWSHMRARLLAGSALIPVALALAPIAKADVIINGVDQGNIVTIGQFGNALSTSQPEVIGLNSTGSFLQNAGTNIAGQQSVVL